MVPTRTADRSGCFVFFKMGVLLAGDVPPKAGDQQPVAANPGCCALAAGLLGRPHLAHVVDGVVQFGDPNSAVLHPPVDDSDHRAVWSAVPGNAGLLPASPAEKSCPFAQSDSARPHLARTAGRRLRDVSPPGVAEP